jgi:hypothetical protein
MKLQTLLALLDVIDRSIVVRRAIDKAPLQVIAGEVSLSISSVSGRYEKALGNLKRWAVEMGLDGA